MITPNSMPRKTEPTRVIVHTKDACWDERCDCTQEVTRMSLRRPRAPRPIRNFALAEQLREKGYAK